jgi:hypothetical protein
MHGSNSVVRRNLDSAFAGHDDSAAATRRLERGRDALTKRIDMSTWSTTHT